MLRLATFPKRQGDVTKGEWGIVVITVLAAALLIGQSGGQPKFDTPSPSSLDVEAALEQVGALAAP